MSRVSDPRWGGTRRQLLAGMAAAPLVGAAHAAEPETMHAVPVGRLCGRISGGITPAQYRAIVRILDRGY